MVFDKKEEIDEYNLLLERLRDIGIKGNLIETYCKLFYTVEAYIKSYGKLTQRELAQIQNTTATSINRYLADTAKIIDIYGAENGNHIIKLIEEYKNNNYLLGRQKGLEKMNDTDYTVEEKVLLSYELLQIVGSIDMVVLEMKKKGIAVEYDTVQEYLSKKLFDLDKQKWELAKQMLAENSLANLNQNKK